MQAISKEILARFQIRCRWQQKTRFIEWLTPQLRQPGYRVTVEESHGLTHSRNIVVGDIARAKIIFSAHYDTSTRLPFPNFLAPKNLLASFMFQLFILLGALAMALPAGWLFSHLTGSLEIGSAVIALAFALFFFILLAGPPNKANANDNTSGVITLVEALLTMPKNARNRVAFVFFDNEEKGMTGAAAFLNRHKTLLKEKVLINFDCVSDGDDLYFAPKGAAKKDRALAATLVHAFRPTAKKRIHIERKLFLFPSDQSVFKQSVAVCALRPSRLMGPHIRRIHTRHDTIFDERNIELLRRGIIALAEMEN